MSRGTNSAHWLVGLSVLTCSTSPLKLSTSSLVIFSLLKMSFTAKPSCFHTVREYMARCSVVCIDLSLSRNVQPSSRPFRYAALRKIGCYFIDYFRYVTWFIDLSEGDFLRQYLKQLLTYYHRSSQFTIDIIENNPSLPVILISKSLWSWVWWTL